MSIEVASVQLLWVFMGLYGFSSVFGLVGTLGTATSRNAAAAQPPYEGRPE